MNTPSPSAPVSASATVALDSCRVCRAPVDSLEETCILRRSAAGDLSLICNACVAAGDGWRFSSRAKT